jgi:hypothetical protein
VFAYNDQRDAEPAVRAIESTIRCISADCIYWFSNQKFPKRCPNIDVIDIHVPALRNFKEDINSLYLNTMPKIVATDFNLVVQPDGFAVNPQAWDDLFWQYDYTGAVWPFRWGGGPYWGGPIVGNGGFSLRSRRLYDALIDLRPRWRLKDWAGDPRRLSPDCSLDPIPEDILISIWYREILESKYGIKFCPPELAMKFSIEGVSPYTQYWVGRSFGFHGAHISSHYGVQL